MSYIKNFTIESSLSWQQYETINDTTLIEDGTVSLADTWTSGTGQGQINKSYYISSGISGTGTCVYDLFSLNRPIFGQNLTVNFSGDYIKLVRIENKSTGIGQDLFIACTGTGGFSQMFGYGYLGWILKPESYSIFFDRNLGYPVDTGNRYIYIKDISGTGVNYELSLFGVTYD